jgi:Ca2+-binding RTX toxin-like protein
MSGRRTVALAGLALIALAAPTAARADTGTFSNTTAITIPQIGQGSPYPAEIAVTGLNGLVSDVNATLVNINHGNPDDIDVLMVGPGGQTTVLISDVGGTVASVNDTITLDDSATFPAPDMGGIVNGVSHKPADYGEATPGTEPYNAPAPPPPHGLTMSTQNGASPNGSWSLFVFDDFFSATGPGAISGGWSLAITTVETAATRAAGKCRGKDTTIGGTPGADTLEGTPGADVISALGGKDKITGLAGKDLVCGGPGRDRIAGGKAKDRLFGEGGRDRLLGQGGKDTCVGGGGEDRAKKCEVERKL